MIKDCSQQSLNRTDEWIIRTENSSISLIKEVCETLWEVWSVRIASFGGVVCVWWMWVGVSRNFIRLWAICDLIFIIRCFHLPSPISNAFISIYWKKKDNFAHQKLPLASIVCRFHDSLLKNAGSVCSSQWKASVRQLRHRIRLAYEDNLFNCEPLSRLINCIRRSSRECSWRNCWIIVSRKKKKLKSHTKNSCKSHKSAFLFSSASPCCLDRVILIDSQPAKRVRCFYRSFSRASEYVPL